MHSTRDKSLERKRSLSLDIGSPRASYPFFPLVGRVALSDNRILERERERRTLGYRETLEVHLVDAVRQGCSSSMSFLGTSSRSTL